MAGGPNVVTVGRPVNLPGGTAPGVPSPAPIQQTMASSSSPQPPLPPGMHAPRGSPSSMDAPFDPPGSPQGLRALPDLPPPPGVPPAAGPADAWGSSSQPLSARRPMGNQMQNMGSSQPMGSYKWAGMDPPGYVQDPSSPMATKMAMVPRNLIVDPATGTPQQQQMMTHSASSRSHAGSPNQKLSRVRPSGDEDLPRTNAIGSSRDEDIVAASLLVQVGARRSSFNTHASRHSVESARTMSGLVGVVAVSDDPRAFNSFGFQEQPDYCCIYHNSKDPRTCVYGRNCQGQGVCLECTPNTATTQGKGYCVLDIAAHCCILYLLCSGLASAIKK